MMAAVPERPASPPPVVALVEVGDTLRVPYVTGIQRTVREVLRHWPADAAVQPLPVVHTGRRFRRSVFVAVLAVRSRNVVLFAGLRVVTAALLSPDPCHQTSKSGIILLTAREVACGAVFSHPAGTFRRPPPGGEAEPAVARDRLP